MHFFRGTGWMRLIPKNLHTHLLQPGPSILVQTHTPATQIFSYYESKCYILVTIMYPIVTGMS